MNYPNIYTSDNMLIHKSLVVCESENVDFVDSILVAYYHLHNAKIYTFDKKLN